MVSPLNILAKVSLRATAFVLDLTLESTRLATSMTIDLARRSLACAMTAVSGMQRAANHPLDNTGGSRPLNRGALVTSDSQCPLAVMERYSTPALYLMDHGLNLAELLAMSGIFLAQSILRIGVSVAHEGVHILDEIFDRSESSRALATLIQLCRRELSEYTCPVTGGGLGAVAALIKGTITFAVVQRATHHRIVEGYKMRLVHEGIVIDKADNRPNSQSSARPSSYANESVSTIASTAQTLFTLQERHGLDRDSQSQSTCIRRYQLEDLPSIPSQSDSVYERSSTLFSSQTNADQSSTIANYSRDSRPRYVESIREPAAAKIGRYGSLVDEQDWLKGASVVTHDTLEASHSPLQVATANQQTGKHCRLFRHRSSPTGITPEWKQKLGRLQRRCTSRGKAPEKSQSKQVNAPGLDDFQAVSYERSTTPTRQPTKRRGDLREFWLHRPSLSELSDDEDSVSSSPLNLVSLRHRRQQSEPHGPIVPYRVSSLKRSAVASRVTEPAIEVVLPTIASVESAAALEQTTPSRDARSGDDPDVSSCPFNLTLVEKLQHFMRYASASSGHSSTASRDQHTRGQDVSAIVFAHHVGIEAKDVLLSSYTPCDSTAPVASTQMTPSVYITLDHANQAVVLTCGGALALSDLLLDLTEYERIETEAVGSGWVHRGIFNSAVQMIRTKGKVMAVLRKALEDHPGYGLVLTGHSVGGSTAAVAALLLSCPVEAFKQRDPQIADPEIKTPFVTSSRSGLHSGRPIQCYGYGSAAVFDPELCKATEGLVTTVVLGNDLIPSLSLGALRDLRQISEMLEYQSSSTNKDGRPGSGVLDILSKVFAFDRVRMASRPRGRDHTTNSTTMKDPDTSLDSTDQSGTHEVFNPCHVNQTDKAIPSFDFFSSTRLEDRPMPEEQPVEQYDGDWEDWAWSLIKTMRAHAQHDKLYPPGRVYCMERSEAYVKDSEGPTRKANRVLLSLCQDVVARFSEPIFCGSMLRDHMPWNYQSCLDLLSKSLSSAGSGEGKQG